jgi:hypothetical protein
MASSSSALAAISLMPVSEKIVYTVWKAQVIAVLWGAQLIGSLDGAIKAPNEKIIVKASKEEDGEEVSNPAFAAWKA